jgi:hypothetical protein
MGEPILNALALPVDLEKEYEEIKQLTSDMITTLDHGGEKQDLQHLRYLFQNELLSFEYLNNRNLDMKV